MTYAELIAILDKWIAEGGEIAKVARNQKARLSDPDDTTVLRITIQNMARYFNRTELVS